ncbi:hypothetical protein K435DRAFT_590968, partial [Dendrothele bispora CBS 962.96]
LDEFHNNKQIFIDLGICPDFHIPKIYFLNHYIGNIIQLEYLDNLNTEYTDRFHIDLAKEAYWATNKDNYLQMTLWQECKEK